MSASRTTSLTQAMAIRTLDARNLSCPLPVLKTRKALQSMGPGEEIEVLVTDPAAEVDFPAFCAVAGHALFEVEELDGWTVYRIRKAG